MLKIKTNVKFERERERVNGEKKLENKNLLNFGQKMIFLCLLVFIFGLGFGTKANADQLVPNGDGESTTGWITKDASLSVVAGGQSGNCFKVENTSNYGRALVNGGISVLPGTEYTYSFYFKRGDNDSGTVKIGSSDGASDYVNRVLLSDADWAYYSGSFTPTGSTVWIRIYGNNNAVPSGYSYYDEVEINGSPPWSAPDNEMFYLRFDGEGTIETAGQSEGCAGEASCSMNASSFIDGIDNFGVNSTVIAAAGTYDMTGLTGTIDNEFHISGAGDTTIFQNAGTLTFTHPFSVSNIKYDTHSSTLFTTAVNDIGENSDGSSITNCTFLNGSAGILSVTPDSDQSINGLTITNNTVQDYDGSSLNIFSLVYGDLSNLNISNNTFSNISSSGGASCIIIGSNVNDVAAATIDDNSAQNISGASGSEVHAFLGYGDSISVDNFTVSDIGAGAEHEAIYLKSTNSEVINSTLTNNYSDDGDITIKGGDTSTNNTVSGNTITSNLSGRGVHFNGSGTISNNTITRTVSGSGISAYPFEKSLTITKNKITSLGDGIYFSGGSGGTISDNILSGSEVEEGIRIVDCSSLSVYNNTVYDFGINLYQDGTSTTGNYYNNIYWGAATTDAILLGGFLGNWDYNNASTYTNDPSSGNDVNANPLFTSAETNDFTLSYLSPAIDSGTDVSLTEDYAGNPIYGLPDIGSYEYQPPYTMGTNEVDTTADVRVYGDGKFRNTQIAGGTTADLSIDPASDDTSEYLDIEISTWQTSGTREKEWTESSSTITGNTAHTVGDLEPNKYYNITADNAVAGLSSATCDSVDSNFVCQADENGQISFTWTGGYSSHTFNVSEGDNIDPTVTDSTTAKFHTDTTSVTLSLTTDEDSTCKYSTENTTYDLMTAFTTTGETSHSTEVNNLTPNSYTYYAICRDGVGNDTSHTLSFEIAAEEDEADINNAKLKENGDSQKLNDGKKIYYDQKETRIKGEDPTIANGIVKIYKEGKRIATVDVDSDGKWSKKISFGHNKTYTLKIKFYDEYGTLRDTKEYDVKVDTENPIYTDPFPASKSIARDDKITFTATDDDSRLDYYKVKLLDENGHIIRSWRTQSEDWYKIPKAVENGTYILLARAYDKVGNYAEEQTTISVGENQNSTQVAENQESNSIQTESSQQTENPSICSYTVQQGDTLSSIAKQVYGDATVYPLIIDKNKDKYPDIESKLSIGQELTFGCENNADNPPTGGAGNTDLNTDTANQ